MNALIVIDMQEAYVGSFRNIGRYAYDTQKLLEAVNNRITLYLTQKKPVIYIQNKFFWQMRFSPLVEGLKVNGREILFHKTRTNCFSKKELLSYFEKKNICKLEIVGVDGNYCVGKSALAAENLGFSVLLRKEAIGISNRLKFQKMEKRLKAAGVAF